MGTVLEPPVAVAATTRAPRATPAAGAVLLVLVVGQLLVGVAFDGAQAFAGFLDRFLLFGLIAAVAFGALGMLLARRDPGGRLTLIALGIGWGFGVVAVLDRYAALGVERGWPGITAVVWVSQWLWVPAMWAIPTLLVLRFPDGRLAVPWGRHVERVAVAAMVLGAVGFAFAPYGVLDRASPFVRENPVAVPAAVTVGRLAGGLAAVAVLGSLAAFAVRLRRARGVERAQFKWVLVGTAATVVVVVASVLVGPGAEVAGAIGIALLPAAIAVAVLRHGLWDVDLVIRRSLVYGLLTAIIVVLYVATVGILGGVLGRTVGAPLVATGIIAVAVQPLRERLQRGVNQLLYGDREDPYTALTRLSRQLDATVDRGVLLEGVAGAVVRALRLRGAVIEVNGAPVATVGDPGGASVPIPLTVRGDEVGTLRVAPREHEELTTADRRLLQDLARHVAAVVRAERLQTEVEASRARLVTAREEERRRIRRDLHDELGPTLAAIGLQVERASLEVASDPAGASRRLDDATARVRETVRSVRALVEGLRPAALDELGLAGAVRELIRGLGVGAVEVTLRADGDLRDLPAAVDVAAYRIVGEAVTNVLRHAAAGRCDVTLRRDGERLLVEVEDDGRGLGSAAAGVGRRSMAERATELGGRCDITNRPGGGTRVTAVLPVVVP